MFGLEAVEQRWKNKYYALIRLLFSGFFFFFFEKGKRIAACDLSLAFFKTTLNALNVIHMLAGGSPHPIRFF